MSIRKNTTDSLAGALGQVIPILMNLVFTSIFIRVLGTEKFGFYSEAIILLGYLLVLDFALVFPIMKYSGELWHKGEIEELSNRLKNSLGVFFFIGIIGGVILYFSSDFFAYNIFKIDDTGAKTASGIFKITALNFLGQVLLNWGRNVLNGLGRVKASNAFFISYPVTWTSGALLILFFDFDWTLIFWLKAFSAFLIGVFQIGFISSFLRTSLWPRFSWPGSGLSKSDVKRGVSLRLNDQVFIRYDQFLIGVWLGAEQLGIYSIAFLIPNAVFMVLNKMNEFVVHGTTGLVSKEIDSKKELAKYFETGSNIFSFISIGFISLIVALGTEILTVWVGPGIATEVLPFLTTLSLAFGISGMFAPFGIPFLLGSDQYKEVSNYKWAKSISLLLFVSIGMYFFNGIGAAYGVLLSGIVDLFFLIKTAQSLTPGLIYKISQKWIIGVLLFLVFYFSMPVVLNFLELRGSIIGLIVGGILGLGFWGSAFLIGPWIPKEIRSKILKFDYL